MPVTAARRSLHRLIYRAPVLQNAMYRVVTDSYFNWRVPKLICKLDDIMERTGLH